MKIKIAERELNKFGKLIEGHKKLLKEIGNL